MKIRFCKIRIVLSIVISLAATLGYAETSILVPKKPNCGLYAMTVLGQQLDLSLTCEGLAKANPSLNKDLVSFAELLEAAKKEGIELDAVEGSMEQLKTLSPPAILGLNPNHLVALTKLIPDGMQVIDQSGVFKSLSWKELEKNWSGKALILSASPALKSPENPSNGLPKKLILAGWNKD